MDVKSEIFQFLRSRSGWTETREVLDFLAPGHESISRKSDVNPYLYELQREGKIVKDPDSDKPRWRSVQNEGQPDTSRREDTEAAPELDSSCRQQPLDAEPAQLSEATENAKSQLLELFGQHAVKINVIGKNGHFRATALVGQLEPHEGKLSPSKSAAQQTAAEAALRHVRRHPEFMPQECKQDFKSQLQKISDPPPSFKTDESDRGGFTSTVTLAAGAFQSQQLGRRKIDAEQFAAKAALDGLRPVAGHSPPASLSRDAVDKELQMEAIEEQLEEHEKLKEKLQSHPSYEKIYGNFGQCIKEAFKDQIIDQSEKQRLQAINGRGNCAKHKPERLQPKQSETEPLRAITPSRQGPLEPKESHTVAGHVSCPSFTPEASKRLDLDSMD